MNPPSPRLPARPVLSLVRASLELGRDLADKDAVVFRSQGTCMYPAVRPGDLLVIRSRRAADVRVDEIAVCRGPECLFGHRVIETGLMDGRPFIVTRPDRSGEGASDGPTFDENLLGVVVEIRRKGRSAPLEKTSFPRPVGWAHSLRLGLGDSAAAVRMRAFRLLAAVQGSAAYRFAAAPWLARARRRMIFTVRVPFSSALGDSVFKEFPADAFDPSGSWLDKPIVRWTLAMTIGAGKGGTPAARMTFARTESGAWEKTDFQARSRFRGLDLEGELERAAARILAK